ncbi:MAG: hypothetical protein KJ592_01105 [Nanoarchaeota archaeon]|nr:hypothetical protein [Nanoarchaeota archaeon]
MALRVDSLGSHADFVLGKINKDWFVYVYMGKRAEFDIGLFLMLLGAVVIIVWALLKSFGIINTPVWVEMLPYLFGGVSIFGAVAYFFNLIGEVRYNGKILRRMEGMRDDFIEVRNNQRLCLGGKLSGSPYVK